MPTPTPPPLAPGTSVRYLGPDSPQGLRYGDILEVERSSAGVARMSARVISSSDPDTVGDYLVVPVELCAQLPEGDPVSPAAMRAERDGPAADVTGSAGPVTVRGRTEIPLWASVRDRLAEIAAEAGVELVIEREVRGATAFSIEYAVTGDQAACDTFGRGLKRAVTGYFAR